ncbi:MAG: DpnI domain-containing protein [Candidatus Micrarchaeota archaeon]
MSTNRGSLHGSNLFMSKSSDAGNVGEIEVVKKVHCPNCGKMLARLPPNYPLYDVQCTGCSFRAQVKTNNSKPTNEILGAGWDIIDKVLKSGFMIPPLIVNFKWIERGHKRQKIVFYPFVPKENLKKRVLPPSARRANYKMFNYIGLKKLPHFVLYRT